MLHDYAVKSMESRGAVVTPIDLDALQLPLYDPNEEGNAFPEAAQEFKDQLVNSGTTS